MTSTALKVLRHVMLYGLDRTIASAWCPTDATTVSRKAGCPYPFMTCSLETLAEVRARIGLKDGSES